MKKFLIFVLLLALGAAAFFTRPVDAQKSFTDYLVDKVKQKDRDSMLEGVDEARAAAYAKHCDYKDRYLWVDVQKDGKTVYTGALAHWFNHAEFKETVKSDIEKAKEKAREVGGKARDEVNGLEKAKEKVTPATTP